ncbi:hypothetical protein [Kitasatospora sp. NPDC094015]|uniref:hypothetical protein n=1 Tax=Kitasatospora sp. NPDC094015 TaxID=3155205 RepID=UPI003333EA09
MSDPMEHHGGVPAPVRWVFVVREAAFGPPFAEALLEVGPPLYEQLAGDAVDSGFVLAAGEPPATTAEVRLRAGALVGLVLVGGRRTWEPAEPAVLSPGWLAAADARGGVVMVLAPPATLPPTDPRASAETLKAAFSTALEAARERGRLLHGMAALTVEGA